MSVTRRIAFGAAASWFSRGVSILLGLVLMPVLFRHLPKEELGVWLLLGQSWAALGIFDLGFGVTLTRRIAFAKGKSGSDPNVPLTEETLQEIADLVATGRRVYHLLAIFAFTFSLVAGFFYLRSLDLSAVSVSRVWLAWGVLCLSQAVGVWAAVWTCLLQGVGYVGWDSVLGSTVNFITLVAQLVLVLLGGGLVTLAAVAACGAVVQRYAMLGFAKGRRPEVCMLRGRWDGAAFRSMRSPAIRAWLTSLGFVLVANTDQFFIASSRGAVALPAYRAAFLLVVNLHLLAGVFAGSSGIFISHLWQAKEYEQIHQIVRRNSFIGLLAMGCGGAAILGLGSTIFDVWLGKGNFVGYPIMAVFLVNFILEHHANVFASSGRATNDEAYAVTSVAAGALKLAMAFLLTGRFGLLGLALSTLLAQGLTNYWFMVYRASRRLEIRILDHLLRVVTPSVAIGVAALVSARTLDAALLGYPPMVRVLAVSGFCGLILAVALWGLALNPSQRRRLLRSISSSALLRVT